MNNKLFNWVGGSKNEIRMMTCCAVNFDGRFRERVLLQRKNDELAARLRRSDDLTDRFNNANVDFA